MIVFFFGSVCCLATYPHGIGRVDGNIDVVYRQALGRREVRAMTRPVGVLIHDEANKVVDTLIAILRDGKEERSQILPKGG